MIDFEKMKQAIANKVRDKNLASSSGHDIEPFAKHWPYSFVINDWDVWNESKKFLKLQVIRWLEARGAAYEFSQFRSGCGLIGFESQEAAHEFKLRWSNQTDGMPVANQGWNPHPLRSNFEPSLYN
jgi:hypothetical protein